MTTKPKTPTITTAERLTERLVDRARAHGQEAHLALPPAAAAVLLLGAGDLHRPLLCGLAAADDPAGVLSQMFEAEASCVPYLGGGILDPLLELLTRGGRGEVGRALAGMFEILAGVDLQTLAETPVVAGDILGPIYTLITSDAARSSRGSFYTPPSVGRFMAQMIDVQPGSAFSDPCCGTGGLAIATIRSMRTVGRMPELVRWHLQDLDPIAVALAGVQLAAHGMPCVELVCANTLTHPPR